MAVRREEIIGCFDRCLNICIGDFNSTLSNRLADHIFFGHHIEHVLAHTLGIKQFVDDLPAELLDDADIPAKGF